MKEAFETLLIRLQEPSTIRGLTYVLGGVGVTIDPEWIKQAIPLVFIIVGVINVLKKDAASKDSKVMEAVKTE